MHYPASKVPEVPCEMETQKLALIKVLKVQFDRHDYSLHIFVPTHHTEAWLREKYIIKKMPLV